jgi:hypothetical protein
MINLLAIILCLSIYMLLYKLIAVHYGKFQLQCNGPDVWKIGPQYCKMTIDTMPIPMVHILSILHCDQLIQIILEISYIPELNHFLSANCNVSKLYTSPISAAVEFELLSIKLCQEDVILTSENF